MENPYLLIIVVSSCCGLAAGFLMHRANFCVAGAFRDLFLLRNGLMLRCLLLLVVASMVLFQLGLSTGLLSHYPFPILAPPSWTNLVGGMLFGVGMVLAGGCVVGTLYKMGAGSMLSIVAFVGLLVGSVAYAPIHPWWSGIAGQWSLGTTAITLPQWLSLHPALLTTPLIVLGASLLWHFWRRGTLRYKHHLPGSIQPMHAALGLAAVGMLSYALVGMPLGITTSYAKWGALLIEPLAADFVAAQAFFQTTPVQYTPPLASVEIHGGAGPGFDGIAAIQYPLIIGITLGGFTSAWLLRAWHIHYRLPWRQYVSALLGGILLGLASRMVPGCNIWHLWGGLPILALQSMLFLVGILPGAWLGSKLLSRVVLRI